MPSVRTNCWKLSGTASPSWFQLTVPAIPTMASGPGWFFRFGGKVGLSIQDCWMNSNCSTRSVW